MPDYDDEALWEAAALPDPDVCAAVLREVWGQPVQAFSNDGGRTARSTAPGSHRPSRAVCSWPGAHRCNPR